MLTNRRPPAANVPGPLLVTAFAHESVFVVVASSRNSEQQIMMSGTDQSTRIQTGAGVGFQPLILNSSNLLAVCGGVDESCTLKVRS